MTPSATAHSASRQRFKRFARIHIAVTLAMVTGIVVWGGLSDTTSFDWHFAAVCLVYWLALLPLVRFVLDARRLWRPVLLAGGLGVLLFVGGLELVGWIQARRRGVPELSECGVADRRLHHGLLKNTRMRWGPGEFSNIIISTNADGLRTPYSRDSFSRAPFRVAVLGDSYAFGFLVQHEDSVPAALEGELERRMPDLHAAVLNAGLISYSPILEHQLFEDVVKHYQPHVTLMTLNVTDIGDDYKYGKENTSTSADLYFPFPDEYLRPAARPWEESPTLQLIRLTRIAEPIERLMGIRREAPAPSGQRYRYYEFRVEIGGVVEHNHFFAIRHPLEETRPFFEETLRHIVRTRDACRAAGSKFALVLMPYNFQFNNDESPDDVGRTAHHYRGDEPHRLDFFDYFVSEGRRAGIEVINLLPAFRDSDEFPLCFKADSHFNAAGNRLAAETIAKHLVESSLLPQQQH